MGPKARRQYEFHAFPQEDALIHPDPLPASVASPGEVATDFAAALGAAMDARDLPLERIRHHLAARGHEITIATLSYWRSGRSRPERASSLACLGALEEVLRVPRGSLAQLLPPHRRQTAPDAPPFVTLGEIRPEEGAVLEDLIADIDLQWGRDMELLSTQDLVEVDPDRHGSRHVARLVIRSLRDRLDRFPVSFNVYDDGAFPAVTALFNCRNGRTARNHAEGMMVVEMLLDQPVRLGESVSVEFEMVVKEMGDVTDGVDRGVLRRTRELYLEVAFDPEDLPTWVSDYRKVDGVVTEAPLRLAGHRASTFATDFGPGLLGINWGWDPPPQPAAAADSGAAPPDALPGAAPTG